HAGRGRAAGHRRRRDRADGARRRALPGQPQRGRGNRPPRRGLAPRVPRLLARPARTPAASGTDGAGLAAVIAATVAFSWGFVIVSAVGLGAAALAFWRLLLGVLVLAGATVVLRVPWPRQRGAVLGAGVMFGLHQFLFIVATQTTTIAIVSLLGA